MTPGRYRDITSHVAELKVKSGLSGHSRPEIILDKVWVELNKTVGHRLCMTVVKSLQMPVL